MSAQDRGVHGLRIRHPLLAVVVLSLAVVLVAVGCARKVQEPAREPVILHDWFTDDPGTLDVQQDTTLAVYGLARELFNTLVRYKGETLELEPELLESMPTISADGKVYTFKLKQGILCHDGKTELTSKDVKFTFERMLDPNGKGLSTWLYEPILGAKDMVEGKAAELKGFKIINDYEFEITLEKPYAPFLHNLAVPSASIYPAELCKAAGEEWGRKPVGTGPFKLKEYTPSTSIVLEKNPYYFEKGLPYLDGIEYRIVPDEATGLMEFEKGTFDVTSIPTNEFERITKSGQYTILESTPLNTYYFVFNMKEKPYTDVRVRKAIAMAIDKQKIIDSILGGRATVAKAFVTPGIPGAYPAGQGPAYDYNPAEAKKILEEAGLKKIKAVTWQRGGTQVADTNIAIQAMLKEIGIDLEVQIIDRAAFGEARAQGKVPANYGNWWADIPDPDNYLYTYFHPSQSRYMSTNYDNPRVTALLDEARITTDPARRAQLYQEAEKIIVGDDAAIVPLFHKKDYLAVQKNVKGIIMHPTGVNSYKMVQKEPAPK